MPQKFFVHPGELELNKVVFGVEAIREMNPQRHEMEQLHGILLFDPENRIIAGYRDVKDDEFWVRGHIPGRPLLPGVLMVECAAQLSSFYYRWLFKEEKRFFGFGGIENVRFRGTVVPGDRLIMVGKCEDIRLRRAIFDCQGFVKGKMVFEGRIIGMIV